MDVSKAFAAKLSVKSIALSGDMRPFSPKYALSCRTMLTAAALLVGLSAAGNAEATIYTYQGNIFTAQTVDGVAVAGVDRVTAKYGVGEAIDAFGNEWSIKGLGGFEFLDSDGGTFDVKIDTNGNVTSWNIEVFVDVGDDFLSMIRSNSTSGDNASYSFANNKPCGLNGMTGDPACTFSSLGGINSSPGTWSPTFDPAVLVQPKDAVVISGGDPFGAIGNTYNQSGLETNYIDEKTRVDAFAPTLHTPEFPCCEWFSDYGTNAATVSYLVDAKRPAYIDHLVLWNEETSGIGSFDLYYGETAGALTTQLLYGVSPIDNLQLSYPGEVFRFDPSPKFGWYTLVASDCPQNNPGGYLGCAIGEVAFGGPAGVPEPASWALLIAGFGMTGAAMRRRAAQAA